MSREEIRELVAEYRRLVLSALGSRVTVRAAATIKEELEWSIAMGTIGMMATGEEEDHILMRALRGMCQRDLEYGIKRLRELLGETKEEAP